MKDTSLPRAPRAFVLAALAGLIVLELVTLTGIVPAPHHALLPSRIKVFTACGLAVASLVHARLRPPRAEIGATAAVAALIFLLGSGAASGEVLRRLLLAGASLGEASLIVLASRVALAPAGERRARLDDLGTAAVLPLFITSMQAALSLTVALHPSTYDGALYHLDAAVSSGQASFWMGRLFHAAGPLATACSVIYAALPLATAALLLRTTRTGPPGSRADLVEAFLIAGILGYALYHLCPVMGPAYAFATAFPDHPPALAEVAARLGPISLAPRNAVPSLHVSWAIFLVWHARDRGAPARAAAIVWLVATVAATLGLGEHYLVDLVMAVPFAVAADALATCAVPLRDRARILPVATGAALLAVWLLLCRSEAARHALPPIVPSVLAVVTLVLPLALRRGLLRATAEPEAVEAAPVSPRDRAVAALGAGTGLVATAVGLVLDRALLIAVCGDARVSAAALVAGLAGLGLGAWLGGRLAVRRGDPAKVQALATLALGAYGALAPLLVTAVRGAFVALAAGDDPFPRAALVRMVVVALAVLPPALIAGAALSLLAAVTASSWLPAAIAFGGVAGALGVGLFAMPTLGLTGSAVLTAGIALAVALAGLRFARSQSAVVDSEADPTAAPLDRAQLTGAGILAGGLVVAFAHLLAVTLGDGAHAIPRGLAAASLGLGAGAVLAARRTPRPVDLGAAALVLALVVLGGALLWEDLPGYFASYERFSLARDVPSRELVLLAAAFAMTALPAALLGFLGAGAIARARGALPLACLGGVLGSAGAAFVVLPSFGALRVLHVVAAIAVLVGLLPLAFRVARGPVLPALAAVAAILLVRQPARFDAERLATGAALSFAPERRGTVIAGAESLGGMVTVSTFVDAAGAHQTELAQRGRRLGDAGGEGEPADRTGLAVYPALHTQARGSALVIGAGTFATAEALRRAGFARVDVVEPDPDVVTLAQQHFQPIAPTAHVVVADGRGFLLTARRAWDVILVDSDDVWSLRGASLHSRELIALAKERLAPGGVLAASFPLHRVSGDTLVGFVTTVHAELPSTWLYAGEARGAVVACAAPCPPGNANLAAVDHAPEAQALLAPFGSARGARRHLVLDPARVANVAATGPVWFGDDDLRLAVVSLPGAVLGVDATLAENRSFLAALAARSAPQR